MIRSSGTLQHLVSFVGPPGALLRKGVAEAPVVDGALLVAD